MSKGAYLVLRRQLIWDSSFQSSLDELIAFCKRVPIDAVALFTMSQELYHPTTESLDKAAEAAPYLARAGEALRREGIGFQVQLIGMIGHGDFGAPKPPWATWQNMVGDDGVECTVCPCPLDKHYHEHLRRLIRIYAPLKPDILWVDDDFRMHNHDPAKHVCFCPDHLTAFSKRMGKQYTREELSEAVLRSGPQPTEERVTWLSLLGEDQERLAGIIQQELAQISPETRMGDMCSTMDTASAEGRDWDKTLKSLCGPHRPALRPALGSYCESTAEGMVSGLMLTKEQFYHFGKSCDIWPELENYPFSPFGKSVRTTSLQIALSQLTGTNGITLDLHDFLGTPLAEYETEEKMLAQNRLFLDSLANLVNQTHPECGIRLLSHPRQALYRRTGGVSLGHGQLYSPQAWAVTLPLMGFATTFEESPVVAMVGQKICAYSDEEIEQMLKGGCMLDASAAVALVERGYGSWIGLDAGELIPGTHSGYLAEEIAETPMFAGMNGKMAAWLFSGSKYRLSPQEDASVLSHLLSAYGDPIPGLVTYENQAGGRVATWAYDGTRESLDLCFRNWKRQQMLERLIEWLGRQPAPFFVRGAANVLPIRRDGKDFLLLAVANLSLDTLCQLQLVLGQAGIQAENYQLRRMNKSGQLEEVEITASKQSANYLEITCQIELQYMEIAVLVLRAKAA
ncbi:MAG: hypothetical protein KAT11_01565 [Phycisphaerae bacterium]|nr:hypothetical protein [Phycisphaerae bacterium]